MPTSKFDDPVTLPGNANAVISIAESTFNADRIQLSTQGDEVLVAALHESLPNVIGFFLKETLAPGQYDIGEEQAVRAFYYHKHASYPWNHIAVNGTFTVSVIDLAAKKLEATFAFTAQGLTPDADHITVTDGTLEL